MTNLIPPHARINVIREYWLRVATVWALLLSCAVVAISALLIPTYVSLQSQISFLKSSESTLTEDHKDVSSIESVIERTNALALQLAAPDAMLSIGKVIDAVNDSVPPGVTLRTYRVVRNGTSIDSVEVQGVASSRTALADLKTRIEAHALFTDANVPISDLIKESNLPFAIVITLDSSFNR